MDDELTVEPKDDPQVREIGENMRRYIEMFGWDKFEEMIVTELKLVLMKEENGQRFYEREDGLKITVSSLEIDL